MKTKVLVITNEEKTFKKALFLAEKFAQHTGLPQKNAMQLRLLTEEMLGMMRSITGTEEGEFWIEEEDGEYRLHLQTITSFMDYDKRESLLAASKSGRNEAARGFMGKIQSFFDNIDDDDAPVNYLSDSKTGNMYWSMRAYEEELHKQMEENSQRASEEWDEMEKSVVFHLADDVKVSIRGRDVEMIIIKQMK